MVLSRPARIDQLAVDHLALLVVAVLQRLVVVVQRLVSAEVAAPAWPQLVVALFGLAFQALLLELEASPVGRPPVGRPPAGYLEVRPLPLHPPHPLVADHLLHSTGVAWLTYESRHQCCSQGMNLGFGRRFS